MAIRRILRDGDSTLRKISRPVTNIDRRICMLLDDMRQTLYANDGAGLAAPQVGILRRVVVVDVDNQYMELINPEIVSASGEIVDLEACLSVPGRRGRVARPETITVRALNRKGELKEYTGSGLMARALCHELDHLDGILYLDKMIEEVFDEEE